MFDVGSVQSPSINRGSEEIRRGSKEIRRGSKEIREPFWVSLNGWFKPGAASRGISIRSDPLVKAHSWGTNLVVKFCKSTRVSLENDFVS